MSSCNTQNKGKITVNKFWARNNLFVQVDPPFSEDSCTEVIHQCDRVLLLTSNADIEAKPMIVVADEGMLVNTNYFKAWVLGIRITHYDKFKEHNKKLCVDNVKEQ